MNKNTILRLRQNAVSLITKDQSLKQLAGIVAELCFVCEEKEKEIGSLREQLAKLPATEHQD